MLCVGAQAHGFEADLWTLERVGLVIERVTGVALSKASVWRLLTGRLGWSLQRPVHRTGNARLSSRSARHSLKVRSDMWRWHWGTEPGHGAG